MITSARQLADWEQKYKLALARAAAQIVVCAGPGCAASGSKAVYERLKEELMRRGSHVTVDYLLENGTPSTSGVVALESGCQGFCQKGPLVRVEPEGILYTKVQPEDVPELLDAVLQGTVLERLLYHDPSTGQVYTNEKDIPFYRDQIRIALQNCGAIDPEDIRAYIARGGYQGLARALAMDSSAVIAELEQAHLRGRGGGGFPAARKWAIAAAQEGPEKYLICNGDEGDPGAFMDRSIMEGDPHSVIEGMVIAGYAIGASQGFIYVRAEYPLAVQRMQKAVRAANEWGLLGENILDSGFAFQIAIKQGAGAFVCGEETALIASIEGQRGMPRPKPPFPSVAGLWKKPTVINNVETLANVPRVLRQGAQWFRKVGTSASPGTKTFALAGDVANTGLIEVPMGLSIRDIVYKIGGGLRSGGELKAVQIGGPSGGCLPSELLDIPLDFDSLQGVGAMIGSGGLVVMGQNTCMVEVARFFMQFIQAESCGKCVFCREGTLQMLEILEKITKGHGTLADLDSLTELGQAIKLGSLCGLGKSAPNPVLSTLEHFRSEYIAHIVEKRCPAGQCQALRRYTIDPGRCRGCSRCVRTCPAEAIAGTAGRPYVIDQTKCLRCGACVDSCKFQAIEVTA
ncbi:MAG: NADH-quinone oxidoreductase subunit NuoF [Firmicutes bacterium]|nr:NADH-quinone oxidoreductase subunit NuoF [Bacillota bacterium]